MYDLPENVVEFEMSRSAAYGVNSSPYQLPDVMTENSAYDVITSVPVGGEDQDA